MAPPVVKKVAAAGQLPQKERGLFTRLIQEYETKKYKTGLKTADTILKKFPEHGETLCMKGLILASLNRKTEGLDLAKQGVRYDLTSFIAWHALGILNRMSKNYNESIKCYLQALKIEGGNNGNLIRESAYLYLQLREYGKLVEARANLVRMSPHLRMNWIGLIVALHLGGDLNEAIRVLEKFEQIHRDVPKKSFEASELYLYHAQILLEAGKFQDALDFLDKKSEDQIVDRKASDNMRAQALLQLKDYSSAEKIYESLIRRNQEDRSHIQGWLTAKGINTIVKDDADSSKANEAFEYLSSTFATSRAIKRLSLVYAQGESFRQQAKAYIGTALQKGVPSIFTDVKSLYGDDEKRKVVEEIVEGYRIEWEAEKEIPSSYLWAIYFLAQHYSFLRQSQRALIYINSAIAHSPTMPELHMTRARILKRAGSLAWAKQAMEDARLLDGQDRFLNCKAAKYLLRIGQVEEARERVGLFTKPDAPSPVFDLNEMQATWYLLEEERAFARIGNYAMALKTCGQLDKIFTDIWDDQLDFHSYCLRKSTLRAYINMVRFEDILHSHPVYFHTATDAIKLYLKLHDDPSLYQKSAEPVTNGLSKEARKKAAQKARKQEAKAAEEAKKAEIAAAAAKQGDKKVAAEDEDTPLPAKDEDPDGEKALAEVNPLLDAQKYLSTLQRMASRQIETWLLTFEVAIRGKDWLLATKALAHAHQLDPSNATLHTQIIALKLALPSLKEAPEPIGKSIEEVLNTLIPTDVSLSVYNSTYGQKQSHRADALLATAKASVKIDAGERGSAIASIMEIPKRCTQQEDRRAGSFICSISTLIECKAALEDNRADEATFSQFDESCHGVYPMADDFKTESQKKEEQQQCINERRQWDVAKADGDSAPVQSTSILSASTINKGKTNGHI